MPLKTGMLLGFVTGVVLTLLFVLMFPSLIAVMMTFGLIAGAVYAWFNYELILKLLKSEAPKSEPQKPE